MTRNRIGGVLDLAALAVLHRPTEPAALRQAALDLVSQGLTVTDAAVVLKLSPPAVAALLGAE